MTSSERPAAVARGSFRRATASNSSRPRALHTETELTLVGTREDEQILRKPHEPLHLLAGGVQRGLELLLRPGPPRRELELGPQGRERRPELVARVGDEAPLAREAGVEALEHLVQRLAEAMDLVARLREREAALG